MLREWMKAYKGKIQNQFLVAHMKVVINLEKVTITFLIDRLKYV